MEDYIIEYEDELDVQLLNGIWKVIDNNPSTNTARVRMDLSKLEAVKLIYGVKEIYLFEENAWPQSLSML